MVCTIQGLILILRESALEIWGMNGQQCTARQLGIHELRSGTNGVLLIQRMIGILDDMVFFRHRGLV